MYTDHNLNEKKCIYTNRIIDVIWLQMTYYLMPQASNNLIGLAASFDSSIQVRLCSLRVTLRRIMKKQQFEEQFYWKSATECTIQYNHVTQSNLGATFLLRGLLHTWLLWICFLLNNTAASFTLLAAFIFIIPSAGF